jgi:hypothetical protein
MVKSKQLSQKETEAKGTCKKRRRQKKYVHEREKGRGHGL